MLHIDERADTASAPILWTSSAQSLFSVTVTHLSATATAAVIVVTTIVAAAAKDDDKKNHELTNGKGSYVDLTKDLKELKDLVSSYNPTTGE